MKVFLGIGSNIMPQKNVSAAKLALKDLCPQVRFSSTYRSAAVGFDGDDFFNLVAEIETQLSLTDLVKVIKKLEAELGRVREDKRFSSRVIDIDILLYDDLVCLKPLQLPRDEIRHNAYVLRPLAELACEMQEPGGSLTYAQLWQAFDKKSQPLTLVTQDD